MKFLINCIKGFYSVSIVISLLSFIGIFVKGPEWIVVFLMSLFMCLGLRKEYKGMEDEVERHLNKIITVVNNFILYIQDSGNYSFDYQFEDRYYHIELRCDISAKEGIGAVFMGEYERVCEEYRCDVEVVAFDCRNQFDEVCDCGFTAKDINELL